jgi:hypothetical protein
MQDKPRVIKRDYLHKPNGPGFSVWEPGILTLSLRHDGRLIPCLNSNIFLLCVPELPLEDGTTIDPGIYIAAYLDGFEDGEKWFTETYKVSNDVFWTNSKDLVAALKDAFFVCDPYSKSPKNMWSKWLTRWPLGLSIKGMKEFGFYAALYSSVIELKFKHPKQFKDFDKVEEPETNEVLEDPINGSLKRASHYFILLWELGLIDALKKRCEGISAQRLGEIIELITGQKSDDFRKAISQHDPSTYKIFNVEGMRAVAKQLSDFGITPTQINKKLKTMKK